MLWTAAENDKYCSKMEEIIPRQTVHSMYRKMAVWQSHMDCHLLTISLYYQNMQQEICHVCCHMSRECTEICNSLIRHAIHDLELVIVDNQTECYVAEMIGDVGSNSEV